MTVLFEECDDGGGGGRAWLSGAGGGGGEAAGEYVDSSSGLAMRRPPSDWDRLRSPDIAYGCSTQMQYLTVQRRGVWTRTAVEGECGHEAVLYDVASVGEGGADGGARYW